MANCQNNMRYMRRPMTSSPRLSPAPAAWTAVRTHSDFFPSDIPLAMAYVKWQEWQDLYEPCKALKDGTFSRNWINRSRERRMRR